jgi:hypothetical protein
VRDPRESEPTQILWHRTGLVGLRRIPLLLAILAGLPQDRGAAEQPATAADLGGHLQSLDGVWQIAPDPRDQGIADHWYDPARYPGTTARPIQVPGNINEAWPNSAPIEQDKAANLDWYMLAFTPETSAAPGLRHYLRFGGVRYVCEAWLNGKDLGSHEGGQDPFECDVTQFLRPGRANTVIVRVASPSFGGIQQHVALVSQPEVRILDAFARPDAGKKEIRLEVNLENNTGAPASLDLTAKWGEYKPSREIGSKTTQVTVPPGQSAATLVLPVPQPLLWSFDEPNLYTIGIASRWPGAPTATAGSDKYRFRTGFRDFRLVDGFFYLNGKRVFLKSTHSNWYDPIGIMGTPRTMKYLKEDFPLLKKAGFNTLRFIISAALPEQLDEADELGFMVYSEHETSWEHFLNDPAKFGISLNQVVRRDRNHPSLVMWGLLNETHAGEIYNRAKAWLPSLRAVDDTRLVMLSSGRWDDDFRTASASNPGSATWNDYLGGEDPIHPVLTGVFRDGGGPINGSGDFHIYAHYPTSWGFVTGYESLGRDTKPFFQSEIGDGSSYDAIDEKRGMEQAGAPATAYAWIWINPAVKGLRETWKTYDLRAIYPTPEDLLVDSALSQSRQRAKTFSIVRSNPKVNGFNLTSLVDCWGAGEGFMDSFRQFKPGELAVLQAGWAPLRWCLLLNPTNVYADKPLRIRVALANEDLLAGGDYPAELRISGAQGIVWRRQVTAHVESGANASMACAVFDEDVAVPGLSEGTYTLSAELSGRANAAASSLAFNVTRPLLAEDLGAVTVLGLDASARDLLLKGGATIHDYAEGEQIDREVILVGASFNGRASAWRALYARCARGAHVVFLAPKVFLTDLKAYVAAPSWLALAKKGALVEDDDWLYHKDVVAMSGPAFDRLQTKLMTPEYYEGLLAQTPHFEGTAHPDETDAVAIRCVGLVSSKRAFNFGLGDLEYADGVMLGTYRHHAGRFTINALNILGNLGNPAADRLLFNLVKEARSDAAAIQPLPPHYDAEMDSLGIADSP